jgi:hypothetical protein
LSGDEVNGLAAGLSEGNEEVAKILEGGAGGVLKEEDFEVEVPEKALDMGGVVEEGTVDVVSCRTLMEDAETNDGGCGGLPSEDG